ncbi:GntR family transcriptional regulator [Sphingomonas quercus]|uniref:GntR family transcriptional regulator n=1 Tax=Sphingomonas quercus TaxID=2842451 RepID=A0ABS6BIA9_9SPHN|nr:GntR family transcriptional regulator [Sphingomonas quercus]MBU3077914.1 GntR family transcriptional regulator [Sphingomonas quercus]
MVAEVRAGSRRRIAATVATAAQALAETETSPLHASVYEDLRQRLITGKIAPGVTISTRGLAQQLGVSQMPVRDALSRLAAEGAVEIRSKRKIMVPRMTTERLDEIMRCRMLLEPEAAVQALPYIDASVVRQLKAADAAVNAALETGDVNDYMENNFRFHFLIYRAGGRSVILPRLIETLWLQFGPLMRVVYGRVGTVALVDQHALAMEAIARRDADGLRAAVQADIADGVNLVAADAQGGALDD